MASNVPLADQQHLERARRHMHVGTFVADAGEEWAAVMFFYAAYHRVKAALLTDPIFGDPTALSRVSVHLTPEDRFTDRHHGARHPGRPPNWGINELVLKLYPTMAGNYERLHQGSISVRYSMGLPAGALDDLRRRAVEFIERADKGALSGRATE